MPYVSGMRAHARADFARLAYLRAVAAARAEPTAAHWARLLRAARNLKAALSDRDRERASGGWRARPERPSSLEPRRSVPPSSRTPAQPQPGPASGPPSDAARAGVPARSARWPELEREVARARELIAQSRRLVAEAQVRSEALRDMLRKMETRSAGAALR